MAKIRTVVPAKLTPGDRSPLHDAKECPECGWAGFVGRTHEKGGPTDKPQKTICFGRPM
jgi:hypothetical protein